MAILDTVKKVIPYIKEATGYVLCNISSQAVEMDDGTLLQDKIESMDSEIDGKANTSHTHTATQITGLTASRAMVSDGSGHPAVSNVTATELNCLDGATSNIQDQINTLNSNLSELNGKLNMKTYDQGGITVNKINDMCFCNLNITFDNTIEPWGGTWYLGNIADPEFRAPYEKHFPCVGINQEAGISYALRISVAASGNVTIINDTKDYISPKLIYANFSYRFES